VYNIFQQQDHYKVLGLGKLRHKATAGDIKKACKYRFVYNNVYANVYSVFVVLISVNELCLLMPVPH